MTNVPVKRGEAARQQPQVAVTDADREVAKRFVYDYNVRDIFQAREGPIEDLADIIASARADADEAGYSRGLREGAASERERCLSDIQCADTACNYATTAHAVLRDAERRIRARGEGGKA